MQKDFYKSKTFWASVCIALGVVGEYLSGHIAIETALMGVGGSFGLFGIRDALK